LERKVRREFELERDKRRNIFGIGGLGDLMIWGFEDMKI
jgi:hypothetical protein